MNVVSSIFHLNSNFNLSRPHGFVELLLGLDYCILLPNVIKTVGDLQLLRNQFGYTIRGYHPLVGSISSNDENIYHVNINIIPELNEYKF